MEKIAKERVELAARIYSSNKDAAIALGILRQSFSRLCRQYGIESPSARRKRIQKEGKKNG